MEKPKAAFPPLDHTHEPRDHKLHRINNKPIKLQKRWCTTELEILRGPQGLPVERDRYFSAAMSLTEYAVDALRHRAIRA